MKSETRVAFNTFLMYVKAVVSAGVTFFATRIVLAQLGEDGFGVYNLVASIVGMLSFFSTSASIAAQRYMSHALGMNDRERYYQICRIASKISFVLGIVFVVVIEIIVFFFADTLNVPPDKLYDVKIIFQCVAVSVFFTIVIAVPYESQIIANEDLFVVAIIYIVESIAKLGVAFLLFYVTADKLIVYSILISAIYVLSNVYKMLWCRRYGRSVSPKPLDMSLLREMARFSGWTSLEPVCVIFSSQGMNWILNVFGGVVVNTAYAITNQVSGQMNFVTASLMGVLNPLIMKSEGGGDKERAIRLSIFGCKMSFFLLAFFVTPVIVEMPYILDFWLEEVPEYTVIFCRLVLVSMLIMQLTYGLQSGIIATGNIRHYQTVMSIIRLIALPTVYLLLKVGYPIYWALVSFSVVEFMGMIVRLYYAQQILGIDVKRFMVSVMSKLILSCVIVLSAIYGFTIWVGSESLWRLIATVLISSALYLSLFRWLILDKTEYNQVKSILLRAK
ncbi:MAG: MATE family efflux transporter [Tannerella sp.]|jgi:Na+-driven multidrug efflux pump|nr:MATE family efflux transporter [Tannerella sp.]